MSHDYFSAVLDPTAVQTHALDTAASYNCPAEPNAALQSFLTHPLVSMIISCNQNELESMLCNDFYKPRMHNLYADIASGVHLEFMLAVRSTPMPLLELSQKDPELWELFLQACNRRLSVDPYPQEVLDALQKCMKGSSFQLLEAAVACGKANGVAPVTWGRINGELLACACGPAQSASHVETTLTQLVQEVTVAAQIRKIAAIHGVVPPSNEELLGNSLARLALGVEYLNRNTFSDKDINSTAPSISLFAGRRSSRRSYLLLQNLYCAFYLKGFNGTSSILAATLLPRLAEELSASATLAYYNTNSLETALKKLYLVGTLAHEVPMALEQLLGHILPDVNSDSNGQPAALLAHLLMLRANGGLATATALPDTFGTRGFLATALVAHIPHEFKDDMVERFSEEWGAVAENIKKEGAVVFDLFRVWRMDSGDYTEMATAVADAWEGRWGSLTAPVQQDRPCQPLFMHSNLGSYEEVVEAAHLPLRIRPEFLAFGTLADGFLPFLPLEKVKKEDFSSTDNSSTNSKLQNKEDFHYKESLIPAIPSSSKVRLASVVMKVVQARHPSIPTSPPSTPSAGLGEISYESAGKLGDDVSASKVQVDRRLPVDIQNKTLQRLKHLAAVRNLNSEEASHALATAYHMVTRGGVLR